MVVVSGGCQGDTESLGAWHEGIKEYSVYTIVLRLIVSLRKPAYPLKWQVQIRPMLLIRIRMFWPSRIRQNLYGSDPDLYPDPSIIKEKIKKNLYFYYFWLFDFWSLKTDVKVS